jgi:hypothetical protein
MSYASCSNIGDGNSAVGSLAVDPVGIYPWLSSAIIFLPCLNVTWTHATMAVALGLGLIIHAFWVIWNLNKGVGLDCMVEVVFDIPFMPLLSSCSAPSI